MSDTKRDAIRDLVKGAGVVYTGLLVEVLLAFFAQLLAARYLSLSGFGGLTTGTALVNVGAVVGTAGLGEGLIRYLPRVDTDEERRFITWLAYLIVVPISVLLGLAVALNAGFIASTVFGDPSVTVSIRIFGLAIPFGALVSLSVNGIRGRKRSRERVYVENFVRPIARFALVAAVVVIGVNQARVASAYAIPYALGGLVATVLFLRSLPNVRQPLADLRRGFREYRGLASRFVRYSLPFTLYGAAGFVFRGIDIFLLLGIKGSEAVGTYGVAYAAARLVLMFSTAFNFLGAPISSELEATEGADSMVRVQDAVTRWLVVLSVPAILPFLFFPTEFIAFIYRPRYAPGALALAILSVGFAAHNVLSVQSNLLRGMGSSDRMATYNVVAAVVNVGLNLWLIPRYSFVGAAVATVVAYLVKDLLMTYRVKVETGTLAISRGVLVPAALAVPLYGAGVGLARVFPKTFPGLLAFSAVLALAYVVAIVLVQGFTEEEVMLVDSVEERFEVDLGPVSTLVRRFS
jgi:O-antigen/teichoic acid export membrane protein